MALEPIIVQAGRHFADSLNMGVMTGSGNRRQESTKLAWMLVGMLRPRVTAGLLEVDKPGDQDISRLASEILGVGASLELLRRSRVIDGRTIRKRSGRFDFEANGIGAAGRIKIEAKGTTDLASVHQHRTSFKSKLASAGLLTPGSARGYSQAIGIIFSSWTRGARRRHDVEILDPEADTKNHFEESVRETIRFYSRRYDESAGLPQAAERLWHVGDLSDLFEKTRSLDELLGREDVAKKIFSRGSFRFHSSSPVAGQEFWGSFWEGGAVPCPFIVDQPPEGFSYAYTGIDHRILGHLRNRRFHELLKFELEPKLFSISGSDGTKGVFLTDSDGIIRGWMNRIPKEVEFQLD